jgi:pyruvate dehydrogenase E2 component (dihydrolipoamide acetyltransferase)
MSGLINIKVPDIGDFKDVPVIEVFVRPGDRVKAEDPLVSLESDKATMEVPSPREGVVKFVVVKVGDKVSEGAVIVQFESAGAEQAETRPVVSAPPSPVSAPGGVAEVRVPDIGDFKDVPVIEIFVKPGDSSEGGRSADRARVGQGDHGSTGAAFGHGARNQAEDRRKG